MESDQLDAAIGEEQESRIGRKFQDIIDRIELLRKHVGMTKSAFGRRIGVKAQTYNNFTGNQGTKPNVELLYGIVTQFGVHPMWLLSGKGEMFMEGRDPVAVSGSPKMVPFPNWPPSESLSESTKEALSRISPVIERVEAAINKVNGHAAILERVVDVLRRYSRVNPKEFEADVLYFIAEIEQKISVN